MRNRRIVNNTKETDERPIPIDSVRAFISGEPWPLESYARLVQALEHVITTDNVSLFHYRAWGEICFTYLYAAYSFLVKGIISPADEEGERAWRYFDTRLQMLNDLMQDFSKWPSLNIGRIMGYEINIHPSKNGVFISIRHGDDLPKWLKYEMARHVPSTLPFTNDPPWTFNWSEMFGGVYVFDKIRELSKRRRRIGDARAKPGCMADEDLLNILMNPIALLRAFQNILGREEIPKALKHRIVKIIGDAKLDDFQIKSS